MTSNPQIKVVPETAKPGPGDGSLGAINGLSRGNYAALRDSYRSSPVYQGTMTDESVALEYTSLVTGGTIGDEGYMFGEGVDINYTLSPDVAGITQDSAGKPLASPYAPSPASPGKENGLDATKIPQDVDMSRVKPAKAQPGDGGLQNPATTSHVISGQTIGKYKKGSSTPI